MSILHSHSDPEMAPWKPPLNKKEEQKEEQKQKEKWKPWISEDGYVLGVLVATAGSGRES